MFSLKFFKFIFLLLSFILYAKTKRNISRQTVVEFDEFLVHSGWTKSNDMKSIIFRDKTYYLKNLIVIPTDRFKCNKKIRILTLFLGCIYGKVMNILFCIISNILQYCKKKLFEEKDLINGRICTEELIIIITKLIIPVTTLMKGAIDALDLLHTIPLASIFDNYHISSLLGNIGNILDKLKVRDLSRNNINTYSWTINTIDIFFKSIIVDVHYETSAYCTFVPYDANYLWNECSREYKAIKDQGQKLRFFKFITSKIKGYIRTVIIEKYMEFGFKFDPITEETFITTRKGPIKIDLELKAIDDEPLTPIL
ncbi:uncharacterized protein LOC126906632 [Daktulosphaira vitifoliae]|uniref:uncharacterized protein LOC126906632 n=1 Tax=Daktulosphaira vitifoliae TaxID=58002 RepID=UPI0021A98D27|nr:uncharacterized protein LOC126906632 [Daktulosphaira vitifoliae]